jgi:hypothetical protein
VEIGPGRLHDLVEELLEDLAAFAAELAAIENLVKHDRPSRGLNVAEAGLLPVLGKWLIVPIWRFFTAVLIELHIQWAGQKWMDLANYMELIDITEVIIHENVGVELTVTADEDDGCACGIGAAD